MAQKKNRRNAIIAALAVLVVALAVGGTIAWLTSESKLTNSFTVGGINDPDNRPDPNNPDNPSDNPLEPDSDDKDKLDGNLYESKWVNGSKLIAGDSVDKNPNVGVGKESEDSYVFLYVHNATMKNSGDTALYAPYFELNSNWAATNASAASTADSGAYVGGLFMYSGNGTDPSILAASDTTDSWTGEAFSTVVTPDATTVEQIADNPTITVYSYVYSAENTTAQDALAAARTWAQDLAEKISEGTI